MNKVLTPDMLELTVNICGMFLQSKIVCIDDRHRAIWK